MERRFASALLLVSSALSQQDKTSLYRKSDPVTTYLIGSATGTTETVKWSITTQTWLNEDTGAQQLVITHELIAKILKTDTVKFELTFIPASKWIGGLDNANPNSIGEDGGQCVLANNAADTQFWTHELTDIWYKCDPGAVSVWGGATEPNKCSHTANTWGTDTVIKDSTTNNWSTFEEDNDSSNPWCVPPDQTSYSPFACKSIKCIMQRPLKSPDTSYDWSFDPVLDSSVQNQWRLTTEPLRDPAEDYMIIQMGRARVWITSATYSVAMAAPVVQKAEYSLVDATSGTALLAGTNGYIAIPIKSGAVSFVYASAVSLLVLGGYLFL